VVFELFVTKQSAVMISVLVSDGYYQVDSRQCLGVSICEYHQQDKTVLTTTLSVPDGITNPVIRKSVLVPGDMTGRVVR